MQLLRKIAFPISLIYAAVVHVRNLFYDWGIFTTTEYETPTICVGNLSVGGTGKTPMVEYLVELLSKDHKIAVLSRGYKRATKGFLLAQSGSTVRDLGDEPYQLHRKYPKITVAVDANRRRGISVLEKTVQPDVIILDDAFQHRKVKPRLSILLTPYDSLYINDWYLPTGDLRDAKNQAKRAEIIVVTKCPAMLSNKEQKEIIGALRPEPYQTVLFASLDHGDKLIGAEDKIALATLKNKKLALVTGIANPRPLEVFLNGLGVDYEHFKYADHHFFSSNEIAQFSQHELVVTTSKDFTRLEGKLKKLYYVEVEHVFSEHDSNILGKMINGNLTPGHRP